MARYKMFNDFAKLHDDEEISKKKKKVEDENSGYLMSVLEIPKWEYLIGEIEPRDFASTRGLEYEPHCTILYGFDINTTDPEAIERAIRNLRFNTINDIRITGIGIFENSTDVLHLTISSPLHNYLHKYFKNNFDNYQKHSEYTPHITLGYLESGKGEKYLDLDYSRYLPDVIETTTLVYSETPVSDLEGKYKIEL